jgi:carboxymethylenebutenolidase
MFNRRDLMLAAVCLLAVPALASADIKLTNLKLKSGETEFRAVLAMPDGPGPFPAIVVIQEWWGLNDWIIDNAKHFAELGYIAIAPDLYHGKVTDNPSVAGQLMKGLPPDRALRDLKTCVDELVNNPKVNKEKIGCIGWCMGGGYTLQAALNDPRIAAAAICYGRVVDNPETLQPLKAAILGVFGAKDQGIPVATVRKFEEAAKTAGKTVEKINVYPAGHGFMRPTNGPDKANPVYDEASAKDAWKQIDTFFAKYLGGKA